MSRDILTVLTVILITILGWIGFELRHSRTFQIIPEEAYQYAQPIEPDFDRETLEFLSEL